MSVNAKASKIKSTSQPSSLLKGCVVVCFLGNRCCYLIKGTALIFDYVQLITVFLRVLTMSSFDSISFLLFLFVNFSSGQFDHVTLNGKTIHSWNV